MALPGLHRLDIGAPNAPNVDSVPNRYVQLNASVNPFGCNDRVMVGFRLAARVSYPYDGTVVRMCAGATQLPQIDRSQNSAYFIGPLWLGPLDTGVRGEMSGEFWTTRSKLEEKLLESITDALKTMRVDQSNDNGGENAPKRARYGECSYGNKGCEDEDEGEDGAYPHHGLVGLLSQRPFTEDEIDEVERFGGLLRPCRLGVADGDSDEENSILLRPLGPCFADGEDEEEYVLYRCL